MLPRTPSFASRHILNADPKGLRCTDIRITGHVDTQLLSLCQMSDNIWSLQAGKNYHPTGLPMNWSCVILQKIWGFATVSVRAVLSAPSNSKHHTNLIRAIKWFPTRNFLVEISTLTCLKVIYSAFCSLGRDHLYWTLGSIPSTLPLGADGMTKLGGLERSDLE